MTCFYFYYKNFKSQKCHSDPHHSHSKNWTLRCRVIAIIYHPNIEYGSTIVFQCERVGSNGVWGWLPDWGWRLHCIPSDWVRSATARPREAQTQSHFLYRAKRLVGKGNPFLFVAQAETVEDISCSGVHQISPNAEQICHRCDSKGFDQN
jgi:hypothetical protein